MRKLFDTEERLAMAGGIRIWTIIRGEGQTFICGSCRSILPPIDQDDLTKLKGYDSGQSSSDVKLAHPIRNLGFRI